MPRRTLLLGLTLGLAAGILTSCGDSNSSLPSQPANGSLIVFVGDTPACDILTLRLLISGLTLRPQGTEGALKALPENSAIRVNFAGLRDTPSILSFVRIEEGTYDQAAFSLSLPYLVVFDPTLSPPARNVTPDFPDLSPKFSIQPPLTVTKDKVSALRVDFDLLRSVAVDEEGQVTGKITPVIRVTPVSASETQGFGELDGVLGFVQSVSTTSAVEGFTGSIALLQFGGTGPAVAVNLTSTTQLFGVASLSQLLTGSIVTVEGFVDAKGNFVARTVEVGDREVVEVNKVAFVGPVTSATPDAGGNVTQFDLFVSREEPEVVFDVPYDSTLVVNVSPSTTFGISSRTMNFADFPFDKVNFSVGQEVIVAGTFTKTTGQPTTVAADSVYLKQQTVQGRFSSLVQAGSDDKTGAFRLAPCPSIFRGTPLLVFTNNETRFVNVVGLSGLTPQPTLLVKGLLFNDVQGRTFNGVTIPPGTLVLLARQVHELI